MKRPTFTLRGALIAVFGAALIAGCAVPPRYGDTYYGYQANRPQSVEMGVVESVRPVNLQGPNTGVGTVGGAVLGGIGGSQIGGGSAAHAAGAIAGAILGGVIGSAVEQDASRRQGLEITTRLDSGRLVAIVQDNSGEVFRPGDRVRLLSDGYTTRVAH
jgi:outer membrane lipoprotein SlyB